MMNKQKPQQRNGRPLPRRRRPDRVGKNTNQKKLVQNPARRFHRTRQHVVGVCGREEAEPGHPDTCGSAVSPPSEMSDGLVNSAETTAVADEDSCSGGISGGLRTEILGCGVDGYYGLGGVCRVCVCVCALSHRTGAGRRRRAGEGHHLLDGQPQLEAVKRVADADLPLDLGVRQVGHDGAALHVGAAGSDVPGGHPHPQLEEGGGSTVRSYRPTVPSVRVSRPYLQPGHHGGSVPGSEGKSLATRLLQQLVSAEKSKCHVTIDRCQMWRRCYSGEGQHTSSCCAGPCPLDPEFRSCSCPLALRRPGLQTASMLQEPE